VQVREFARSVGPVDVLVNCAGIYGPIGRLVDNDLDEWEHGLRVNLLGTLYLCREVVPSMIERGHGSIINMSGGGATAPLPRFSLYATSKAAVVRLTDTLAAELAGTGVRVNAIAPGAVDTHLQDKVLEAGDRAGAVFHQIRQLRDTGEGATPADLAAQLAVFLASDVANGLTGKLISAPHDPWANWDEKKIEKVAGSPWYTIRRLDQFTLEQLDGEP
jgi:3-oxoacyl-[acyl-carrier protein] reductase